MPLKVTFDKYYQTSGIVLHWSLVSPVAQKKKDWKIFLHFPVFILVCELYTVQPKLF